MKNIRKQRIGIVGCGVISEIYLTNMTSIFSEILEPYVCADIDPNAAQLRAKQFGIKPAANVDELLSDPMVDIVLNLTVPAAHAEISKKALLAGKHSYSEKPIAINMKDGEELLFLAEKNGLFIGAAPDTFLGGGLQTCRKLLDDGVIGSPVFATGNMLSCGPEVFHPHAEFFYEVGAGPLLDMGPYYITALVFLFGPVRRVSGMSKITAATRKKRLSGEEFPCYVDTFISGSLEFQSGFSANITTSWDMPFPYWQSTLPLIGVFGSEGIMVLPDPNTFCGFSEEPMTKIGNYINVRSGSGEFTDVPVEYGYINNCRGLGLADMALSIQSGSQPRVNGALSLHVLEIMLGILESSKTGKSYAIKNTCRKPAPLYHDDLIICEETSLKNEK